MQQLNLPEYSFRIKKEEGKSYILDSIRKKYILITPEEWVRQHFIHYLIQEKNFPESLMAVEKKITSNGRIFRFDLLVYNKKGQPELVAEFKAPEVKISQASFDQVVRYNMVLRVKYIVVSNGMQHFICEIDYEKNSYIFLKEIPDFKIN